MKRIALVAVIVLVTVSGTVALAGAQTNPPIAPPPRAQLTGFSCHQSLLPASRTIFVRAVMRPITRMEGTQTISTTRVMQMQFELLSKATETAPVVTLHGAGLGSWISPPDRTLGQNPRDKWIVGHLVSDLPVPARYRYQVSFRWFGAGGQVLSTLTRRTEPCREPDLRPDLIVGSITVQPIPGKPMRDQYVAAIENIGGTAAVGPFAVQFTYTPPISAAGGTTATGTPVTITKYLQRLGSGAEPKDVTFDGPACTAQTAPTTVVDPDHSVAESNYDNNSLTVPATCPALTDAPVAAP
jgi:hypothetical protein